MVDMDNVNHPTHYADSCSLECIDVMLLTFGPTAVYQFCICNAFKYLWRHKHKNGAEDLRKCHWYLVTAEKLKNTFNEEIYLEDETNLRMLNDLYYKTHKRFISEEDEKWE